MLVRSSHENDDLPESHEINVTPMIDVLLVLIIIFLIVTPRREVGLKTLVPESPAADQRPQAPASDIVITVHRDHTVSLNQESLPAAQLEERLRRLFDMFEHKTTLIQLLETSSRAEGVQIFIGGESKLVPMDEMSVVTAPYEVDGRIVGTLGVIGPTRMAYERVIPIVDITARMLSSALSGGND